MLTLSLDESGQLTSLHVYCSVRRKRGELQLPTWSNKSTLYISCNPDLLLVHCQSFCHLSCQLFQPILHLADINTTPSHRHTHTHTHTLSLSEQCQASLAPGSSSHNQWTELASVDAQVHGHPHDKDHIAKSCTEKGRKHTEKEGRRYEIREGMKERAKN